MDKKRTTIEFAVEGLASLMNMVRNAAAGKIMKLEPNKKAKWGKVANYRSGIAGLSLPGLMPRWLGQHTNPAANERRRAKKAAGGFRQFKKLRREGFTIEAILG